MLNRLQLGAQKTLLILSVVNKNIVLASRNIPHSKVMLADQINTYDLLNANKLLICETALEKINQNLIKSI